MTSSLTSKEEGTLRQYKKDVLAWHGYVRFLGLPDLQNNPDVPLDELYVSQSVSKQHLSTDVAPNKKLLISPIQFLLDNKQAVVLGDPGSGKSTLINWLSWYLSSGLSKKLPQPIGDLIPIPLVLRDLELNNVTDLHSLIAAFNKRPISRAFSQNHDFLFDIIAQGKALLLLDGLDEVSEKNRQVIREIINHYRIEHPNNFLIASSRIVGYDIIPKSNIVKESVACDPASDYDINVKDDSNSQSNLATCYIAPFTNSQISRFSFNWYKEQTNGNSQNAKLLKDEFVEAIAKTESTRQLARTPHLLTMMALIYRIKSDLPDGRALLYDLIAQAYLQSIDTARKIKDAYSWQDKKRWLARVGFEMQYKRSQNNNGEQNLLVTRAEVLVWIKRAMAESSNTPSDSAAEEYLDWIARRSGLLLPRGEGQFAFLHLSFQEYFAGIYIQQQIENPEWFEQDPDNEDATLDKRFLKSESPTLFNDWAQKQTWQQTVILLFESMALKSGWTKRLWNECFPQIKIDKKINDPLKKQLEASNNRGVFILKSTLLRNPHTGFSGKFYDDILAVLFYELLEAAVKLKEDPLFIRHFISAPLSNLFEIQRVIDLKFHEKEQFIALEHYYLQNTTQKTLATILTKELLAKVKTLEFKNCELTQLEFLFEAKELTSLSINVGNSNLSFAPICELKNILKLSIEQINTEFDIETIAAMYQLQELELRFNIIKNSNKLNNFKNLKRLSLNDKVNDNFTFTDINKIKKLSSLTLSGSINSLKGIEQHDDLITFHLFQSQVSDLTPVSLLPNIRTIFLMFSPIQDISPLKKVSSLQNLHVYQTAITDFSALKNTEIIINGIDYENYKDRIKNEN
jgi:hypothetical protein